VGLSSSRIYLDSCIAIYVVERHPVYSASIEALMQATAATFCYSPLVRLECLVKPYRINNAALIALFGDFWAAHEPVELPAPVFEVAARLRACHSGLKTPGAIHFAAAIHHGCAEKWTNDNRLNVVAPRLARKVIPWDAPPIGSGTRLIRSALSLPPFLSRGRCILPSGDSSPAVRIERGS